jgi:hypothetical protein
VIKTLKEMCMARFIEGNEDLIFNVDLVTHLRVRPNGDIDVFVVGNDKLVATLKGGQAKRFVDRCKVEDERPEV